jgi:hypothetical protein
LCTRFLQTSANVWSKRVHSYWPFFNIGTADQTKSDIEIRKAEAEARQEEMKAEVESHREEAMAFHEMMMIMMVGKNKMRIIISCLLVFYISFML